MDLKQHLTIPSHLFLGLCDEAQDLVQLGLADKTPHAGLGQQWVSHDDGLGPFHHLLQELGHDLPLNKHPGSIGANLFYHGSDDRWINRSKSFNENKDEQSTLLHKPD